MIWSARRVRHLLAAVVLTAAAGLVLPAAPAMAASCSGGDGVTVVVDFHDLGGGVQSSCVPDGGGRTATALFTSAGFALDYVQRQPGFVCRVAGQPAADPCVTTPPADAYWALYWSDGTSGHWTYATSGAGSQSVPDGGSVAFSWTSQSGRVLPGATPPRQAAAPSPTSKPTSKPTSRPTTRPTSRPTTESSPTAAPDSTPPSVPDSPSSSASTDPTPRSRPSRGPSSTASRPADQASSSAAAAVDSEQTPPSVAPAPADAADASAADDGLPAWIGPSVVGVLFVAGAAAAVVRRRRSAAS